MEAQHVVDDASGTTPVIGITGTAAEFGEAPDLTAILV